MKIFKETELAQVSAKQYLEKVKNTTRKTVLRELLQGQSLILSHILNETQNNINIVGSMISGYWRFELPKSFLGSRRDY